jgi:hypothetical protein
MRGVATNPPVGTRSVTELKARIDAERAGQPFLLYRGGDEKQQLFFLGPKLSDVSVGRTQSADVVLDWDDEVSRLHARFERIKDDWTVEDGDTLRFGTTTVTFRTPQKGERTTVVAREVPAGIDLSPTQRRVLVALCRPYKHQGSFASPATNNQIAEELYLSVDAVKTHLRLLFAKFGIEHLPQNQKRIRLVERAFYAGLVSERDL